MTVEFDRKYRLYFGDRSPEEVVAHSNYGYSLNGWGQEGLIHYKDKLAQGAADAIIPSTEYGSLPNDDVARTVILRRMIKDRDEGRFDAEEQGTRDPMQEPISQEQRIAAQLLAIARWTQHGLGSQYFNRVDYAIERASAWVEGCRLSADGLADLLSHDDETGIAVDAMMAVKNGRSQDGARLDLITTVVAYVTFHCARQAGQRVPSAALAIRDRNELRPERLAQLHRVEP